MPESLLAQVERHEAEIQALREDIEQSKVGVRWAVETLDAVRVRLERLEAR